MKKVAQVLIMAGGLGTRMSNSTNPLRCKSLIVYGGQTMIGHLLDSLQKVGIEKILIATNTHSHEPICSIVLMKKLSNVSVVIADGKSVVGNTEFNGVPYELKEYLDERFLMVCGHHPVSATHFEKMLKSSEEYLNVFTGYENNIYTMDKTKRIIYKDKIFSVIDLDEDKIDENHLYVRNPYILEKDIIQIMQNDKYKESLSYYIFKKQEKNTTSLGVVIADMPPEFDYDSEYERTKEFLDK